MCSTSFILKLTPHWWGLRMIKVIICFIY
jgi:hypothetical protein